jgi:hypothetical protein
LFASPKYQTKSGQHYNQSITVNNELRAGKDDRGLGPFGDWDRGLPSSVQLFVRCYETLAGVYVRIGLGRYLDRSHRTKKFGDKDLTVSKSSLPDSLPHPTYEGTGQSAIEALL